MSDRKLYATRLSDEATFQREFAEGIEDLEYQDAEGVRKYMPKLHPVVAKQYEAYRIKPTIPNMVDDGDFSRSLAEHRAIVEWMAECMEIQHPEVFDINSEYEVKPWPHSRAAGRSSEETYQLLTQAFAAFAESDQSDL